MYELNSVNNIQESFGTDEFNIAFEAPKNIWQILSILSWILLIACQMNAIQNKIPLSLVDIYGYSDINQVLFEYVYAYIIYDPFPQYTFLIITLMGFIIYLIFTVYQRDENIYSGLFKNFAKFHFLPLFFVSSLYIMNEIFYYEKLDWKSTPIYLVLLIVNSLFTLVGFILLIIVYVKTKLNGQWYVIFFIEKGAYSCLIMLLWGNLLNNLFLILLFEQIYTTIIFPILRAILPIVFSLIFKDIMFLFISLLYNIKTIQNHYMIYYALTEVKWYEETVCIISLAIIVVTLGLMIGIIAGCKHKMYSH